jgi:hypothetical protein
MTRYIAIIQTLKCSVTVPHGIKPTKCPMGRVAVMGAKHHTTQRCQWLQIDSFSHYDLKCTLMNDVQTSWMGSARLKDDYYPRGNPRMCPFATPTHRFNIRLYTCSDTHLAFERCWLVAARARWAAGAPARTRPQADKQRYWRFNNAPFSRKHLFHIAPPAVERCCTASAIFQRWVQTATPQATTGT